MDGRGRKRRGITGKEGESEPKREGKEAKKRGQQEVVIAVIVRDCPLRSLFASGGRKLAFVVSWRRLLRRIFSLHRRASVSLVLPSLEAQHIFFRNEVLLVL